VVCFYHVKSGKYISARMKASLVEKSGFQLSVEDELDRGIFFRICPRYKLRSYGEPIPFGDDVTIEAVSYTMQINFKSEGLHEFDELEVERKTMDPLPFPCLKNKATKLIARYETYISAGVDSEWQIEEFSCYEEQPNAKALLAGQIFTLKHAESDQFLAAGYTVGPDSPAMPLFLEEYRDGREVSSSIQDYWELDTIESTTGAPILTDGPAYYLRHFATGCAVCLDTVSFKGKTYNVLKLAADDSKACHVTIHNCEGEPGGVAEFSQNYNFKFRDEGGEWVACETPTEYDYYGQKVAQFYEPPKQKDLEYTRRLLERKKVTLSARYAFSLYRVSKEELSNSNFILAFKQYLWRFLKFIRSTPNARFELNEIQSIKQIIEEGIRFLMHSDSPDVFALKEKEPDMRRQLIMKEAGIIDLIACVLYYSFRNKKVSFIEEISPQALDMFKTLYLLLNLSIREVRACEIYSSRWLDLFIHQTREETETNELWAEFTLTELLDNNEYLLTEGIQRPGLPSLVEVFVEFLRENRKAKYLKLLTALVNCEDQPIVRNQEELFELMFQEPEKTITVRTGGDTLEIQSDYEYVAIE
jgi:hypothetical protein